MIEAVSGIASLEKKKKVQYANIYSATRPPFRNDDHHQR